MTLQSGIEFSICTYNRSAFLKKCVESLLPQMVPGFTVLTVIDNHSTDDTMEWTTQMMNQFPMLRYLSEPVQGLSHARNTAWRNARFEWVFYLDDDCVPASDLVEEAIALVRNASSFAGLGGKVLPLTGSNESYDSSAAFTEFKLPYLQTTLIEKEYLRGSCMMFKTEVLQLLGGFDTALGMLGDQMRYGEEIELQKRMRQKGFSIAYAPSLVVYHAVREEKLNTGWILSSEYARRRDKRKFEPIPILPGILALLRTILGRMLWLPIYFYRVLFQKEYYFRDLLLDFFKPLYYRWGDLMGSMMYSKHIKS